MGDPDIEIPFSDPISQRKSQPLLSRFLRQRQIDRLGTARVSACTTTRAHLRTLSMTTRSPHSRKCRPTRTTKSVSASPDFCGFLPTENRCTEVCPPRPTAFTNARIFRIRTDADSSSNALFGRAFAARLSRKASVVGEE
jgi:hypothetical protein